MDNGKYVSVDEGVWEPIVSKRRTLRMEGEIKTLDTNLAAAEAEVKRLDKERLSFHKQATEYYEETERLRGLLEKSALMLEYGAEDISKVMFIKDIRAVLGNHWPVCDDCKLDGDCPAQRGEVAMNPDGEVDGKCIGREGDTDEV